MADTAITGTISHPEPSGLRTAETTTLITGTFVANDTDYHALVVNSAGKRALTYGADNPSNKDLTITLYGSPSATAGVGDAGVFQIGTSITVSSGAGDYDTTDDGFAFYIIRCKFAATPNGATVTVYAYLMQ